MDKKITSELAWWRWVGLTLFGSHLVLTVLFLGAPGEYLLADGILIGLTLGGPNGRRFSLLFLPFYLAGHAYDSFHLVVRWASHDVHVADLYQVERTLFSIPTPQGRQILAEFFRTMTSPVLDFFCGCAYLLYMVEAPLLGIYLFFHDHPRMSRLGWAFLVLNVIGLVTFLLYPAAPPWYVAQYGLGPTHLDVAPNPAGAIRFDALVGLDVYRWTYSRAATVFGAMPSLHVAYPVLVVLSVKGMGRRWVVGTTLFALLVMFSAVYLDHHYVLDILAGMGYAVLAYVVVAGLHRVFPSLALWEARMATPS